MWYGWYWYVHNHVYTLCDVLGWCNTVSPSQNLPNRTCSSSTGKKTRDVVTFQRSIHGSCSLQVAGNSATKAFAPSWPCEIRGFRRYDFLDICVWLKIGYTKNIQTYPKISWLENGVLTKFPHKTCHNFSRSPWVSNPFSKAMVTFGRPLGSPKGLWVCRSKNGSETSNDDSLRITGFWGTRFSEKTMCLSSFSVFFFRGLVEDTIPQ